ncbi:arylsulfatase, partial [bacterium]|nr:arylsulfatase [bacterium]
DAKNPHDYYAFSNGNDFQAVLSGDGRWKLHVPHSYRHLKKAAHDGMAGEYVQKQIGYALFDMKNDPFETTNVIEKHPKIAEKLKTMAEEHKQTFYKGKK